MDRLKKQDGFDLEKILVLPEYIVDEISKNPLIQSIYITDIGYFPRANYHYRERLNGCDSFIFIYCAEGEGWIELIEDKKINFSSHMFMVIPEGTPHRYGADPSNPWSIYWFHLKGYQVSELVDTFGFGDNPIEIPVNGFVKFVELFNQCYETLLNKPYSHLHHLHVSHTVRFLLSTLGLVSLRSQNEARKELYLENAINYMNEHLDSGINLSDLAAYAGLSKQHLTHLFNQETGFSPIDYFIRMKMNHAAQMLDLTDQTVKQIAISLGMKDPYYFSRTYKKVMGISPTEYRRNKKG